MSSKAKLKAVNDLTNSKGWAVVKEVMEQEVLQAAMAIAQSPQMSLDEINFRRGSIWAATQMLELPERLKMKLEAEDRLLPMDDSPTSNKS